MSLWGNLNQQNNAPRFTTFTVDRNQKTRLTGVGNTNTTTSVADISAITSYANTTIGAFETLEAVGTFGVNTAVCTSRYTTSGSKGISPGWINAYVGTGPITGVTLTTATLGAGFSNSTSAVTIKGPGTANASGTVLTNTAGNLVSIAITSGGQGFPNAANITSIGVSVGTGANTLSSYNFTLGGRAGRVQYETLVFIKNLGQGVTGGTQNLP